MCDRGCYEVLKGSKLGTAFSSLKQKEKRVGRVTLEIPYGTVTVPRGTARLSRLVGSR